MFVRKNICSHEPRWIVRQCYVADVENDFPSICMNFYENEVVKLSLQFRGVMFPGSVWLLCSRSTTESNLSTTAEHFNSTRLTTSRSWWPALKGAFRRLLTLIQWIFVARWKGCFRFRAKVIWLIALAIASSVTANIVLEQFTACQGNALKEVDVPWSPTETCQSHC